MAKVKSIKYKVLWVSAFGFSLSSFHFEVNIYGKTKECREKH